jgi:hypothetical protein
MTHTNKVENYPGNLKELAKEAGHMYYDSLAEFMKYLADDLMHQAKKDKARGRPQLANKLESIANKLYEAENITEEAWNICKKYAE